MKAERYQWMTPSGKEVLLSELAKHLGVKPKSVRNYATEGRHGIKLRVCRLPQGLGSSIEEYQRWLVEITNAMEG